MKKESREALELFVEKARELAGCGYVKWLNANRGTTLHIGSQQGGIPTIQHTHPDRDATKSLVLTFRFFIQEKDHSSFQWLAKHVVDDPGLSMQWKQGFTKILNDLNDWLDSPSSLTAQYAVESETRGLPALEESQFTMRKIMQIFIYGDFAHANPDKRKVFKRWKADSIWFEMAQAEFDYLLMGTLHAIRNIERLSESELTQAT